MWSVILRIIDQYKKQSTAEIRSVRLLRFGHAGSGVSAAAAYSGARRKLSRCSPKSLAVRGDLREREI
jgi:hypothetical protein